MVSPKQKDLQIKLAKWPDKHCITQVDMYQDMQLNMNFAQAETQHLWENHWSVSCNGQKWKKFWTKLKLKSKYYEAAGLTNAENTK